MPCVLIGAVACRPCTPIGVGWMPWAAMEAGWMLCVLIWADCRPMRSTAISCMGFRCTVVATPTPAWVGRAELGAWGVTGGRRREVGLGCSVLFTHHLALPHTKQAQ